MNESILTSVKKSLGLDEGYTAFDADIVMHINGVLADLNQIGVGPPAGFMIQDKTATWSEFYGGDMTHNNIQTYVSLRVKLLFDPPESGFAINSFQEQINKAEWRISERREEYAWVDPSDTTPVPEVTVLEGGVG
jgi:hypothetical protein